MKTKKRITHAYCVEAAEVLPITGARQFYFSLPQRVELHFVCSTEACRKKGVKVTGVNYQLPPQEQAKHQIAHYRANPVDEHDPACEWVGAEEDVRQRLVGESEQQWKERKSKHKLKDFIDIFDPSGDSDELKDEPSADRTEDRLGDGISSHRGPTRASQTRHSTNSLERLVQCYREAKETLSKEEFAALTINVKGLGELPLRGYFRFMQWGKLGRNDRVLFGGARYKKFGLGFRFDFYDEYEGKPISLYVSPSEAAAYRFREYWFELFTHADEVRYFTVYVLGSLVEKQGGKGYSLVLDDLRHLAITLGPER